MARGGPDPLSCAGSAGSVSGSSRSGRDVVGSVSGDLQAVSGDLMAVSDEMRNGGGEASFDARLFRNDARLRRHGARNLVDVWGKLPV
jgi:hypothetical protein